MKLVYQGNIDDISQIYFVAKKLPWQPQPPSMVQDLSRYYILFWANTQYNPEN